MVEHVKRKWCPKCEQSKLAGEFGKAAKARDGLASWCLKCTSAAWTTAQRHGRNRDKAQFREESRRRAQRRWLDSWRAMVACAWMRANREEVLGR